jgi:GT2 family glycosyltransferase
LKKEITIVIPCYKLNLNYDFLDSLLSSVVKQEESNFLVKEVILVNDSPEYKLKDYVKIEEFPFSFHLIENEKNMGQAFCRNLGLELSTTDFIHFIDQDDLLDSSFYKYMNSVNDCMIANCEIFNQNKTEVLYKQIRILFYKYYKSLGKLKWFLYFDNIILSPGQAVFKTEVLRTIGGFPNLINFGSDDYGLMFKLCLEDIPYSFNYKSKFRHRLHSEQGKNKLNMEDSRNEVLKNIGDGKNNFFIKASNQADKLTKVFRKFLYILFNNLI